MDSLDGKVREWYYELSMVKWEEQPVPYRRVIGKGKVKWVGQVRRAHLRSQKLFDTKAEAKIWEARQKKSLGELYERTREEAVVPSYDLEEFKKKYQKLYENPHNTVGDIFDLLMEEIGVPVRYKDLLKLTRRSIRRKPEKIRAGLRAEVFRRDNYTCQWCGAKAPDVKLHCDHIVPWIKGGLTELRNLQTLCEACNMGKKAKSIYIRDEDKEEPAPESSVPQEG